jgi:hypothetical protein
LRFCAAEGTSQQAVIYMEEKKRTYKTGDKKCFVGISNGFRII